MRPSRRNDPAQRTGSAGAEVAGGDVRDGLAHRDPVAQAAEPGVHGRTVHAIDKSLLEVDRPGVGCAEPDPLSEDLSFGIGKTPPAGIAVQDGGDPPRVRLDAPCPGLVSGQALSGRPRGEAILPPAGAARPPPPGIGAIRRVTAGLAGRW